MTPALLTASRMPMDARPMLLSRKMKPRAIVNRPASANTTRRRLASGETDVNPPSLMTILASAKLPTSTHVPAVKAITPTLDSGTVRTLGVTRCPATARRHGVAQTPIWSGLPSGTIEACPCRSTNRLPVRAPVKARRPRSASSARTRQAAASRCWKEHRQRPEPAIQTDLPRHCREQHSPRRPG